MKITVALIIALSMLFSCEGSKKSPKDKGPEKARQSTPAKAKDTGDVKKTETKLDDVFTIKSKQFDYKYNPIKKRDPFKPYEGEVAFLEEADKTPLERFNISQLQLTAIIWGISEPRALVSAPDGQSYIIKRNMKIGRNSGRVARITKQEVVVAEEYRDPLGKLVVKETPMALREPNDLEKLMIELQ